MMNPSRIRHTHHMPHNRFGGNYRVHVNIQGSASNYDIKFESNTNESKFYIYASEEQTRCVERDPFKKCMEIDEKKELLHLAETSFSKDWMDKEEDERWSML